MVWDHDVGLSSEVHGQLLSPDGELPQSLDLGASSDKNAGGPKGPVVAFTGELYLVVWEEYFQPELTLRLARVRDDGIVLDDPPRKSDDGVI